ncbi:MAG: hypothetical protein QGG39_03025 [Candidatus Poribacteria bacterium]|jgi:TolA-binding protein|nr:hypothetical protein [Candidatus Poribacteria bacterium]
MEQMSTEVQNLAHSIVAPYQQQIDQLQEKIQQQAELINQMEQKYQPLYDLLPVLEKVEENKFHLTIDDKNVLRGLTVLASRLYPVLWRTYQNWATEGGKRPKSPVRQLIHDLLWMNSEKPEYFVQLARSGQCKYLRDYI